MRARPPLPPGPYLIVGLARSGVAAARMLVAHGRVVGVDSGTPRVEPIDGVELHVGSDGPEHLDGMATVVKSPGVSAQAPVVAAARARGLPVVGELELAWRLLPNRFLAVTGTNGKTTTVELLAEILRAAGEPVVVAGNVGTPLASLVGALDPVTTVVCEVSSFQLEDSLLFAPEVAVLLNLAPDHLDRHGTFEAYRAAKLRIFAHQTEGDWAVVPAGFAPPGKGNVRAFGGSSGDAAVCDGVVRLGNEEISVAQIGLRGDHNVDNALAAASAALAIGIDGRHVARALRTFIGVPNRLEEVARRGGVLYVNDSKATNVAAAAVGIAAFPGGVHAILGGSLKGGDFGGLRDPVRDRCRGGYLIGEAGERLAHDLEGTVPLRRCGDLASAVEAAARAATAGEVVLLSPACASYDQYADYEARGSHFRELVQALPPIGDSA
jgi:UDP-N-acetylmuramoylalanine--D-glutamate ligase